MPEQRIRFGANYVPSKYWWYSWLDWDPLSIAGDLQALARLNLDHIRIHCLWPVFQPNANWVSQTAVSRLQELLNIADDNGLDVCITMLNGWLSGFNFLPTWKNDRNLFSDPAGIVGENRRYHLPLLRSQAGLAQ